MSPDTRILLVDDDRTTTFLHHRLLRRLAAAMQVMAVTDGAQALTYQASLLEAGGPIPSLILLDLRMPGLDGWGFLAAYRQLPVAQRQAPVVVLTVPPLPIAKLERLRALPCSGGSV